MACLPNVAPSYRELIQVLLRPACPARSKRPGLALLRSWRKALAAALAAVVLLAQLALAAYACPAGLPGPAGPVAAPTGLQAVAMVADLAAPNPCSGMSGAMDLDLPNLCAEHCKYGQQSDQAGSLTLPLAAWVALYTTAPPQAPAPLPGRIDAARLAQGAAPPPHAVLHCVYRI